MDDPNRSNWKNNNMNLMKPKKESLDFDLPFENVQSSQVGEDNNVASSSRSCVRLFFTDMGYSPSLVDRVIEENGEDNVDLLLEILMEYSDFQKPNSQSSDSLDCLSDDMGASNPPKYSTVTEVKEEPDVFDEVYDNKRESLLKMNFPEKEVDSAMDKLGENAPINEIMDFIIAAQIAANLDREPDDMPDIDVEKKQDINEETLYGTMDITLRLLDMGFSQNEVSLVIDKFGLEVPIEELANAICAHQLGETYVIKKQYSENSTASCSNATEDSRSFGVETENSTRHHSFGTVKVETEDCRQDAILQSRDMSNKVTRKGKRPRQENIEGYRESQLRPVGLEENCLGEQPKQECDYGSTSCFETEWVEEKVNLDTTTFRRPKSFKPNSCKILAQIAAKPPYFFYGNVATASSNIWHQLSQFLCAIEPEYVDTQIFSALSRREGYIHNLPTENRSYILPKPPITLEDLTPSTKKWWPLWDARKKLSSTNFDSSGSSQLCDMLERMLEDSCGLLSAEQQRDLLRHCQSSNLMWVGPNKLAPIAPAHLEKIMGYPLNHTLVADIPLQERMYSLGYSFQTDTLGYHLSVLKLLFPQGITVLSLFSGIGGAEITLHRLGIHLKVVVSVEASETNRRIFKRWWYSSRQTGRLEQIQDIRKLTNNTVETLVEKFGCFDFVICQNSFDQSSKIPKVGSTSGVESHHHFDFTLFNEFVRVLQCVRSTIERKRHKT